MQHQGKPRLLSTGASSSARRKVQGVISLDALIVSQSTIHPIGCPKNAGACPKEITQYQLHRETVGLMLRNFHVGDRVEDKETHERGHVTFVYSTLELRDEFIAVLFDGHDETLAVPADSVRKVSTRQS